MNLNEKFNLYLPGLQKSENNHISAIGINVREAITEIGIFQSENGSLICKNQQNYYTKDFNSLQEIIRKFMEEYQLQGVSRIGIAVPGPVIHGKSSPQRLGWHLDVEDFKNEFGFEQAYLLNDLESSAYGISLLSDQDLTEIYKSENYERGNVAILAPGNGLGEAGFYFDGKYLRPFATEGGHSEFSPRTNVEVEFYQFLNHIYGIVSWENVLSRTGLFNIYRFLRDVKRHPEPEWLSEKFSQGDFVEELYKGAIEQDVLICQIALNTYVEFLAREANSLTLKLKATGGLIISGDIPQIIKSYITTDKFYEKFMISDKMETMLKNIPIYMVEDSMTGINGAALYACFYNY